MAPTHVLSDELGRSPHYDRPSSDLSARSSGGDGRNNASGERRRLGERLVGHIREELIAVDRRGTVVDALFGRSSLFHPSIVGRSAFDLCHPDDLARLVRFGIEGLHAGRGWQATTVGRLRSASQGWLAFEIAAEYHLHDRDLRSFVVRLNPCEGPGSVPTSFPANDLEQGLEALAGAIPLPIMFLDRFGAAYFVNHAARELCSGSLGLLRTDGFASIADVRDRLFVEETLDSLATVGGERTMTFRLLGLRAGAPERIVEATLRAQGGQTQLYSVVVTLVDVTAHHARESELLRMASCDPLTGLLNRAEIEEALAERLRNDPGRVSLLYCDLDGFKGVNDNYGHDIGDELLIDIAKVLETKTRPGDLVGRLGGDEFAVVLDSGDGADANRLACRISVAIAELSAHRRLKVSASVGASVARNGDAPRDLMRRADAAMYEEKRRRRG